VIFLGPPGAGKGTQAARLAAHLGVPKVSTGDMLRFEIAGATALGRRAQPAMEKGNLAPDDVLVELVRKRIADEDCDAGVILDGFPRTLPQAHGLDEMTGADPLGWKAFDVRVPREDLVQRLSGRRWCPSCQATYHVASQPPQRPGACDVDGVPLVRREDDAPGLVAERLREYEERTLPLVDFYRRRGRLLPVDGARPMDAVFRDLVEAVEVRA
jgi:adenylate kinase